MCSYGLEKPIQGITMFLSINNTHPPSHTHTHTHRGRIYVSRHVVFDDHTFPFKEPGALFSPSKDIVELTTFCEWLPDDAGSSTSIQKSSALLTICGTVTGYQQVHSANDHCIPNKAQQQSTFISASTSNHAISSMPSQNMCLYHVDPTHLSLAHLCQVQVSHAPNTFTMWIQVKCAYHAMYPKPMWKKLMCH